MDVLHTAVWVSDLETMTEFYRDVFGLERSREFVGSDGVTNRFMSGESDAEIQFKYDESEAIEADPGTMDHLAVAVDDVDRTIEEIVEEWNGDVVEGPRTSDSSGVRIAFVTDPEGYTVEIIQQV